MHTRAARLARGWVVGTVATATAALSHALGRGDTPSGLALLCGVVFAGLLATFASGRAPSLPRLVVAVAGGQFAFHFGFSYLSVPALSAPASAASVVGGSIHHEHLAGMVVATVHHHPAGVGIWMAHAVAALVTLAFLRYAERSTWSLLTQVVGWVVRPFRTGGELPGRPRRVAALTVVSPSLLVSRLSDRAVSRRGPPLSVAF